ncbi:MAG TPA: exodeoxyribonuclease V subunit beta [Moraxellaceae bacterium]|nr:exodeoxyribonuclease V subunit beta [Moraxellaceae bacterium]
MSLTPLDVYTLPLQGTRLIEASAGTGKTWTIAGLYVRLLLETPRSVPDILVVTFTKAATAELRDRLRDRIVQMENALRDSHSDDDFCRWALERFAGEERVAALRKLEAARRCFDEAAIFTIHGFCQRVLTETQVPALLVEPDILPDERDLLPMLGQEAWIRRCNSDFLADILEESDLTLELVLDDIRALLRKPYLILQSGGTPGALKELREQRAALQAMWNDEQSLIAADLRDATGISRAKTTYKEVDELLDEIDAWVHGRPADMKRIALLTPPCFVANPGRSKNGSRPSHPFWSAIEQALALADNLCQGFRESIVTDVMEALKQYKDRQGVLTYQDLLSLLRDAVDDDAIAASIRERYGAALIDEFQDTDPLQFRIFDRVYNTTRDTDVPLPLFLVGDPKQAIYSFRGADIFTYLRARESAVERYSLDTNRRSLPPMVDAVNAVFGSNSNAFLFSDLRFAGVKGVPVATPPVFPDACRPLHFRLLPFSEKPLSKERAATLTASGAAEDIVALLRAGAEGRARVPDENTPGGTRPLGPPDIAVLVPSHRRGREMAAELIRRGVAVVQRSEDSVFATEEAADFRYVLEAVAAPGRDGVVKAAVLGTLLGWSVETLFAAQNDDVSWGRLVDSLLELRTRWQQQGFMAMWESLLTTFDVFARLLRLEEGERRLTNLRHLATLMQQEAEREPLPERQLAWLREQMADVTRGDEQQLRLESDAERVQILTVHVSKGLEYPVVFCPFLWEGRSGRVEDRAEYRRGSETMLDIGSADFELAVERMTVERLAESLRVLYVALTRAKYRCVVSWGACKDSEIAPLTWLLMGQGLLPEPVEIIGALKGCGQREYAAALDALRDRCPGGVSWNTIEESGVSILRSPRAHAGEPVCPPFTRSLTRRWRVSSFTGLTATAHETESPDYDADAAPAAAVPDITPEGIHAFPRGARAGVFWHELLEDSVMGRVPDRSRFVADRLRKYAIDPVWQSLVESVLGQWLDTPLGEEGMVLSRLPSRMAEMEFVYPVRQLRPDALQRLPDVPARYREALHAIGFSTLEGYLKGFIDLVCRHDDRYYVIDYKTNWLGPVAESYDTSAMEAAVADAHYYLQYWLYVLALHRHLRVALGDSYDYDRHVGGVRYLFLRGIDSPTQGVYARKPTRALIEALDRLMEGAE